MRIFSKRRNRPQQAGWGWKQTASSGWSSSEVGRPRGTGQVVRRPIRPVRSGSRHLRPDLRPLPATTRESVIEARASVRDQAEQSRGEIQALVAAERAELAWLVEDSVKSSEERLRGAAENRVDLELSRLRQAEETMRAEVAKSVRAEVEKRMAELQSKAAKKPAKAPKKSPKRSPVKNRA